MAVECRTSMRFFAPPAQFEGCFTSFYYLEIDAVDGGMIVDSMQPEWASLRFLSEPVPKAEIDENNRVEGAKFVFTGPTKHPTHYEVGSTRLWGIGLKPIGWARFMDDPASGFADRLHDGHRLPLTEKFAALAARLFAAGRSPDEDFEQIVELFDSINQQHPDEDRIRKIHKVLLDPELASVADFAELVAMNERTLERVCKRYFGFSPKMLLRRQRFLRSLAAFMLADKTVWSSAFDKTYYDQAQFSREFQHFMGMRPSEYAEQDHPILRAFMEQRAKHLGSPVQLLDGLN